MIKKILFAVMLLLFAVNIAHADTHYIATTGNDSTGDGSSGNPWATVNKGCDSMAAGDTLVIKNGTYTGALNMFDYHLSQYPPSGTSTSAYTTIQAETSGSVIIDGEGVRTPFDGHDSDYLIIKGIVFKNSDETVFTMMANESNKSTHVKVQECGFCDSGCSDGNQQHLIYFRWCTYSLIEDCYTWGNGCYRYFILDCDHTILRRCVDRFDRGYGGQYSNMGSFRLYGASYCLVQNCIALDGDQYTWLRTTGTGMAQPKFLWLGPNGSTGTACNYNTFKGCISLNNPTFLAGYAGNDNIDHNSIDNCVFWGTQSFLWNRASGAANSVPLTSCVLGVMRGASLGGGLYADAAGLLTIKNSVLYDCSTANTNSTTDYNVYSGNTTNVSGVSLGANDHYTGHNAINPIYNASTNATGGLKYITRVEASSTLDNAGESSADIGANIIYKIGTTGTVYDETGYNTVTEDALWPFPNEDVIRTALAAYSYDTIDGERGFCSDGETLTKYIWEYLGNTIPNDIYPAVEDTTAPAAVSNLSSATGTSVGTIDLSWTAPGDDNVTGTVTSYDVRYSTSTITAETWATDTAATGEPTPSVAGSSETLTISGLTPGTTYYFAMKSSDEIPNASGLSNVPNAMAAIIPPNYGGITVTGGTRN